MAHLRKRRVLYTRFSPARCLKRVPSEPPRRSRSAPPRPEIAPDSRSLLQQLSLPQPAVASDRFPPSDGQTRNNPQRESRAVRASPDSLRNQAITQLCAVCLPFSHYAQKPSCGLTVATPSDGAVCKVKSWLSHLNPAGASDHPMTR